MKVEITEIRVDELKAPTLSLLIEIEAEQLNDILSDGIESAYITIGELFVDALEEAI